MGSTTAAARLAITASCAPNHGALRSIDVVPDMALPTWAISHTAPDATHRPASEKMMPMPAPAMDPPTLPAAPDTEVHTPATGREPRHTGNGSSTSVHPLPGVEEEVDDGGSGSDQQGRQCRDEDGLLPVEGLVVVLGMRPERPGRGPDDEADQRHDERPSSEPVGELLEQGAAGEVAGIRVEGHGRHRLTHCPQHHDEPSPLSCPPASHAGRAVPNEGRAGHTVFQAISCFFISFPPHAYSG